MARTLTLAERRSDWVFVIGFSLFTLTSLLFDVQTALDLDLSDPGANVLVAAYAWFANTADPMLLEPPLWFRINCGMSAFVYGPFYVVLVTAFVRGWDKIRLPALLYCGAVELSMVMCLGVAFFGTPRPTSYPLFVAAYLPYAVLPALLIHRMRAERPFSRESRATGGTGSER